jgi:DNA-binding NarL/FixJ family response regulator
MIASGQKLKDIAEELSLSLSAVSTHRTRILRKMNMKSNADIIRYALREGLVE